MRGNEFGRKLHSRFPYPSVVVVFPGRTKVLLPSKDWEKDSLLEAQIITFFFLTSINVRKCPESGLGLHFFMAMPIGLSDRLFYNFYSKRLFFIRPRQYKAGVNKTRDTKMKD